MLPFIKKNQRPNGGLILVILGAQGGGGELRNYLKKKVKALL